MTRRLSLALTSLAVAAMLTACADADPAADGSAVARTYDPSLNVDLDAMERRDNGLHVQDIEEGQGEPARSGQFVRVHYTGWLPDGTMFDSSRERGEPLEVVIGTGRVIDGWDQGIPGMRPGGRRLLVIPPDLAYGPDGRGPIPPSATLVFDVELIEARDVEAADPEPRT